MKNLWAAGFSTKGEFMHVWKYLFVHVIVTFGPYENHKLTYILCLFSSFLLTYMAYIFV